MIYFSLPTLKLRMKPITITLKEFRKKKRWSIDTKSIKNLCTYSFQFCSIGRLSHEIGWKYQDVVATLEAKRKVKSEAYYKKKSAVAKIALGVKKDPKVVKRIATHQKIIEGYGHA